MLLAVPFGVAIGLITGALGGGGTILALPVSVYVLGEAVRPASTSSLIVVVCAAGVGAAALARERQVCWRIAFAFSAPAAVGSLLGSLGNAAVSGPALIIAFAPLMLIAAYGSWKRAGDPKDAGHDCSDVEAKCPPLAYRPILFAGFGVGLLTGFFGIGGGFVIVPVLTLAFGFGFHRAVATSLVIIALTGLAALLVRFQTEQLVNVAITATFALSTTSGVLAGTAVGYRLKSATLNRAFAVLVGTVAVLLVADAILLGVPQATEGSGERRRID